MMQVKIDLKKKDDGNIKLFNRTTTTDLLFYQL